MGSLAACARPAAMWDNVHPSSWPLSGPWQKSEAACSLHAPARMHTRTRARAHTHTHTFVFLSVRAFIQYFATQYVGSTTTQTEFKFTISKIYIS